MAIPKTRPSPFSINDLDLLCRIAGHLRLHADRAFNDEHGRSFEEVLLLWRIAFSNPELAPIYAENLALELPFSTPEHIKTLKRAGIIEVDSNPAWKDGRRKPLRTTADGDELVSNLTKTWNQIAARSFQEVDASLLANLTGALREVLQLPEQLGRSYRREG